MVPLKLRPSLTMAALLIVAMADGPASRVKLAEQLARRNPAVKPVDDEINERCATRGCYACGFAMQSGAQIDQPEPTWV
ncbi:hypothetical protein HFRIS_018486 [Herbaspirillum frisingense GSF30]|uniref:Uncharacterized protein n=2 Tax=Herbaspirillum frisingense TaxID=92645 RepID=A0AAI9IBZ6_9BURK|nr:hypothetical protein HFRIS_018486 [Herbaspirillum frisingense GSF30]